MRFNDFETQIDSNTAALAAGPMSVGFFDATLSSGNLAIQSGDTTVGGDQKAYITSEFAVGQMFPLVVFLSYVFFVGLIAATFLV